MTNQHQQRLAAGCAAAQRAIFRADAGVMPVRKFEIREKSDGSGGTKLNFTGYASVTEEGYTIEDWIGDYTEVVRSGAFKRTLGQDPDVMFLLNHGGMTMARTRSGSLRLSEDGTGLHVDADLDPRRSDVNDLRLAIESGDIDEMSFAFRVTQQQWSPDYDQRDILEVDLNGGDVSTVNKGANPFTGGLVSLRSMVSPRTLHSVDKALRNGDALSAGQSATLQRVLAAMANVDDFVDMSLEDLSEWPVVDLTADDDTAEEGSTPEAEPTTDPDAGLAEAERLAAEDLLDLDRHPA